MNPTTSIPTPIARANPTTRADAFSLVEVMVAVTLMSVIVLGLLAMFSQTQRAFRAGMTQVDIMEAGRAACEMIAREMEQTAPTRQTNSVNFYAAWNNYLLRQQLPGPDLLGQTQWRTSVLQDVFFTTRENQTWSGIGYRVASPDYVGTLYRYENNCSAIDAYRLKDLGPTVFSARSNRVVDGVVHFRVLAYDRLGRLLNPDSYLANGAAPPAVVATNSIWLNYNNTSPLSYEYQFFSNAVPAYVEVELGILENKVAERCRNLPLTSQLKFLESKAGNVQIFRQRVPVHNVDTSVYQ